jgi:phosphoglycolate phosphatase
MGFKKLNENQKLVLFDIDRTLITRSQGHEEAFSDAFRAIYGVDTNINIINHHGMTDQAIIIEVLKKNGLAEREIKPRIKKCMNAIVESFQKRIQKSTFRPIKGVKKLLRELLRRNILMGLVTGNLEKIARGKMKKLGLNDYFPVGGFGSDDISRTKLVKLAIKRAEKKFKFKFNDNVFLVGDAPQDIKAGKDAGVKTIGVTTGIYSREHLLKQNPDYILEDLTNTSSILNIIFR